MSVAIKVQTSRLEFCLFFSQFWASLVAQTVKNLPAKRETWVQSLGWEDPMELGMATNPSILAWQAIAHGITKSRTRLGD